MPSDKALLPNTTAATENMVILLPTSGSSLAVSTVMQKVMSAANTPHSA